MVIAQPLRISDLVGALSRKAPQDLAESWDNVGFLAGDADRVLTGVVVSVNLGRESLDQAKATGANLIVCHHPPIFKPVSKLTKASNPYVFEAIQSGIGVVALHTNFDLVSTALNQKLASLLESSYDGFLAPRGGGAAFESAPVSMALGKFITYVPATHASVVRDALAKAGAGRIGDYSHCSFSWQGVGSFKSSSKAQPYVGQVGQLETVEELRLEMVFPWKQKDRIIAAARSAHPYEEMAYDVLKLEQLSQPLGYGFVGELFQKKAFSQFIGDVKQVFKLDSVTVVGSDQNLVKRIAFSPGSGSAFIGAAAAKGVDAYICGEVGYHQMLDAKRHGLSLIVLGHSYSERFFVETAAQWCEEIILERVSQEMVSKVFELVHRPA